MKKKKFPLTRVILAAVIAFFYIPIVYTVVFSFNSSRSLTHFSGFSLRWYEKMFASSTTMNAIWMTFVIAILATILSTIIGTITVIGLSKCSRPLRSAVSMINDLPIMNPDIVTAIGLLMFFATMEISKGFVTLLLAHVAFCTPYVMLSITPRLRTLDPNLADAALDLGANPWQALWHAIIPQLMPGIVSGALIAFTMSFDDFVISYFVTGNGVQNISILVYTMSKRINPSINAISTLVIVIITAVLILFNLIPIIRDRAMGRRKKEETA
ncbi:ABC transporter permease [Butyricicoccus porcorum]|uniref:ABC transporter permease n=1 Tax=Butyricicoccus porcorum TaxID=1945634 RepID=UPI0013FE1202|nr:ABC transporter permease [Butyricicoccus porcorum]MDY4483658.1 ABC transporter permease [Butyricicoccus porcorum]